MKSSPKQHLLTVLLILALMACTACGAPQSDSETSDVSVQPSLTTVLPQPDNEAQGESSDGENSNNCTDNNPHPMGQSIATTYEVSYEQVMTWFCSGYSFENILLALETSEAVDVQADTLLQMLLEKEWEEIWVEVGFTEGR
jgi:hypothetical protein